jgi:hypothetical protein
MARAVWLRHYFPRCRARRTTVCPIPLDQGTTHAFSESKMYMQMYCSRLVPKYHSIVTAHKVTHNLHGHIHENMKTNLRYWRTAFSGIWRCAALVRIDVLEERFSSIIRAWVNSKLGTLAVTSNSSTLQRNTHYGWVSQCVFLCSMLQLLVTASVVPGSPILVTLMKEELRSSETSVLTRATQRNIPEDDILHSHCCENLKSYIALTGWTL